MTANVTHFLLKQSGYISQPYQSFMSMKRFCDCYKWTKCYNFSYNYNLCSSLLSHTSHRTFVLLLITTLPTSTDNVLLTCVLWLQHKGVQKEMDQIPDIHWDCNKNDGIFHQMRLRMTVSHSPMSISGMWLNPLQSHFLSTHLPVSRFGMFGTKRTVLKDSSLCSAETYTIPASKILTPGSIPLMPALRGLTILQNTNLWILPASLESWKRLSRSPVTRKMWQWARHLKMSRPFDKLNTLYSKESWIRSSAACTLDFLFKKIHQPIFLIKGYPHGLPLKWEKTP